MRCLPKRGAIHSCILSYHVEQPYKRYARRIISNVVDEVWDDGPLRGKEVLRRSGIEHNTTV